ncbi:MAG: MerR family transcriptional regulator [Planctomycetota bacterium]
MTAGRRLPEKLYRIGEVMEHTGLSRQTVHFYTSMGLLQERRRTASGYRLYPPSVFATLDRVRVLQKRGLTLAQVRATLERVRARSAKPKNRTRPTEAAKQVSSSNTEQKRERTTLS